MSKEHPTAEELRNLFSHLSPPTQRRLLDLHLQVAQGYRALLAATSKDSSAGARVLQGIREAEEAIIRVEKGGSFKGMYEDIGLARTLCDAVSDLLEEEKMK